MPDQSAWIHRWMLVHAILVLSAGIVFLGTTISGLLAITAIGSFTGFGLLSYRLGQPVRGIANLVTLIRLLFVVSLPFISYAPERILILSVVILALDGLDGFLARRMDQASEFGAWFDAEVDAFLAALLSCLLYQHELIGAWILLPGFLRYIYYLPAYYLRDPDRPAYRFTAAKYIAVFFLGSLCAAWVLPDTLRVVLLALASAALLFSFGREARYDLTGSEPVR